LKQKYASYQEKIRNNLKARLPELETLSPSKQEAIMGILSFEYWDRLREHQSLSTAASIKAIVELLSSLLGSK
jgi:hypothetical protein